MAPWIRVCDLASRAGEEVTLKGWVYNRRSPGKIHFILLRDGTGIAQCVLARGGAPDEAFERANHLLQESAVVIRGVPRADPRAPGGVEVAVLELEVVHLAKDYPITPQAHGPDFLLSNRHLWLRSKLQHAQIRIRAAAARAIRDYFDGRGFLLVDAPIFTPAACEGTTNLFEVKYFDEKAYLTQSGQLYMEAAAMAFGRVYCFGPTFRAERSKTRRHLTEFWMVEPEMAFAELDDVMELAEGLVAFIVRRVLETCGPELLALQRDPSRLQRIAAPFPRISYTEAVERIRAKGVPMEWGDDFGAPQETALSESFDLPVLVHRYPMSCKPFYMKPDPADPRLALCVDMIAPEGVGEIIGGGQREDDLGRLDARLAEHRLPREAFEWYLDLRRYGSVPHGGFGLGLERTVAWLCGTEHVRETSPFPRMLYRIYP